MHLLLGGKLAPQTRCFQPQRDHFLLYAVARLRLRGDNDRRDVVRRGIVGELYTQRLSPLAPRLKTLTIQCPGPVARFLRGLHRWPGRRSQGSCRRGVVAGLTHGLAAASDVAVQHIDRLVPRYLDHLEH